MRESVRTFLAVCRLEASLSFPFPHLEGIFVIFLFVAFSSVLSVFNPGPYVDIRPGPAWNATQSIAVYEDYRNAMAASAYGISALGLSYVLAFLVPLLTAFILAGCFEDGTLHTFLSYPVSRSSLLLVKASMMIIVLGLSATVSVLSVFIFFKAGVVIQAPVALLLCALWSHIILLSCVTILIGVLSRSTGATSVVGILLWYVVALVIVMPFFPDVARSILNPILTVAAFITNGTLDLHVEEALAGITSASLIGVVVLTFSIIVFRRSEI